MNDFRYWAPTEVIFGKDAENKTGEVAVKYGRKALLVYGMSSAKKSGLLDRVEESLKKSDIEYKEFGGAVSNPTLSHAREGIKEALDFGADLIIGIGGGSAIDTAKAIAHGAANPEYDLWDIWTKKVPLTKSLAHGAVLSMAAAGSEMSDSAVLTNEEIHKKSGINTDFNRCRFAIMNPSLEETLSKEQIAAGVTDIMMHTMERYFIPGVYEGITDEIAEGLLRSVIENGRKIVDNPKDYDAMGEVFWASSLSHNNLTECGRGKDFSVHKFGHALSAKYNATHGASLSAVWGAWAETLYEGAIDRFARFAKKVWGIENEDKKVAAKAGIIKTVEFFKSIQMPVNLKELGINASDEDIKALALDATMNDTIKLSRIRPIGAKEAEEIFKKASDYSI